MVFYKQPSVPDKYRKYLNERLTNYEVRKNKGARLDWFVELIEQAQLLATQWLWPYNNERPHTVIGGVPPR